MSVVAVLLALFPLTRAWAQVGDLVVSDVEGPPNSEVAVTVTATHDLPLSGFSLGLCFPANELTAVAAHRSAFLETVRGGEPPDFEQVQVFAGGVTWGSVISLIGLHQIPVGSQDLIHVEFHLDAPVGTTSPVSPCIVGPPGGPTVESVFVATTGAPWVPTFFPGSVTSSATLPAFRFSLPSPTVDFDPSNGIAGFAVEATIDELAVSPGAPNDTYGFSFSLAHDPERIAFVSATASGAIAAVNGGAGPDFFAVEGHPDGVTVGVLYGLASLVPLSFPVATPAAELEYATVPASLVGVLTPTTTVLDWRNGLGDPPIANRVAYTPAGDTSAVAVENGTITLNPVNPTFVRGDCTADGTFDIGDPVGLLGALFQATGPVPCADACDTNDDGGLNIADAISALLYLFAGGTPPPAPSTACNTDPTPDALDCLSFPSCP